MITEDDFDDDSKELLQEVYDQDSESTRLTEMVRKHYLNYLEKQLYENLINSNYNNNKKHSVHIENCEEMCKNSIKKTAKLLEDKAVKACMIAKFYQRAMVKIIAIVRRTTEEKRLLNHLEKCIQTKDEFKTSSKETQTEFELLKEVFNCDYNKTVCKNASEKNEDKINMSLDEKIEMFKKHLQKEKSTDIVQKYHLSNNQKFLKKQNKHKEHNYYRGQCGHREERRTSHKHEVHFSPTSSIVTEHTTPISPNSKQLPIDFSSAKYKDCNVVENESSDDSVAVGLARLFSEEKTELDEIFGIDPNEEPDDPQICKILKEIEEAKISHTKNIKEITNTINTPHKTENPQINIFSEPKKVQKQCIDLSTSIDLSKSLWPCELFRQRRKLSESLARLIEEDMRWHDIIKWKFSQLFGEDSDDEFTPCSPSIELNEVLIGSCIRRISPWVVKYLMKPMRDGLIGNRFLFKKLAKNLARSIIMENQYPDESIVKECVENFFCMYQAVMSLEDLDVNIPSISSF